MHPTTLLCERPAPASGPRWLRALAVAFACCAAAAGLRAQDYKTAFSAYAVDRGKSPATWHDGVSVDPATGAVSVELPLGPGIGEHGLHFTPTLRSRWSPQWSGSFGASHPTTYDYVTGLPTGTSHDWVYYNLTKAQVAGSFERIGGGLSWTIGKAADVPADDTMAQPPTTESPNIASIHFPDGGQASLTQETTTPSLIPTQAQVRALLGKFGYGPEWQIAHDPNQVDLTTGQVLGSTDQGIHLGGDGSLIVFLVNPDTPAYRYWNLFMWLPFQVTNLGPFSDGNPLAKGSQDISIVTGSAHAPYVASYTLDTIAPPPPDDGDGGATGGSGATGTSNHVISMQAPPIAVVIKGDIAYEFTYYMGQYSGFANLMSYSPVLGIPKAGRATILSWLIGTDYIPSKMTNRSGDAIVFTESSASWVPKGGVGVASVSFTDGAVTYQGGTQNPSFTLVPSSITNPVQTRTPAPGIFNSRRTYTSVVNDGSGERVSFTYSDFSAPGPSDGTPWTDSGEKETVLTGVTFPGKSIDLTWGLYQFWLNENWVNLQSFVANSNMNITSSLSPHWTHGVIGLTQTDLGTGQARSERHTRVVPQPNLVNFYTTSTKWLSRTFYDAITHPDGSTTVHRFVEPPADGDTSASAMRQRLAYLKNMTWETREYPIGADWKTDLTASPSSGPQPLAYRVTEYDRWDIRSPANPSGLMPWSANYNWEPANPVPTRTRVWDVSNQVMTTEESYNWDSVNRGHQNHSKWVGSAQGGLGTIEYLHRDELTLQGLTALDPSSSSVNRASTQTLGSDFGNWIWGRVPVENTLINDGSATLAPGQPQPYAVPPVTKTYDAQNRVSQLTRGSSAGITSTVTFQFADSGGVGAMGQLSSATLSATSGSTPLALSGQIGASYGYDSNGFMNLIHPMGGWDLAQAQDALGFASSQTDANNITSNLTWDAAGRLTAVALPSPEVGTTVVIDSDNLGFVVKRGVTASRVRFNAFGEVALNQRSLDGGATWSSHKSFAYDPGGRKVGETIWLSGPGSDQEWKNQNLTASYTHTILVSDGYWDTEIDEISGKVIKIWEPPVYGTETLPAMYQGWSWTFDAQGRQIRSVDPNSVQTTITFGPLTRQVTVGTGTGNGGASTTTFTSDAQGRLAQVTDPANQVTKYQYDPMGRIAKVIQLSVNGAITQTRTWEYNNLGWLTALNQPESGRTEYADFTVTGKPRTTRYGVVNGVATVTTTTGYDALDRVTSITSSDGSVAQVFTYDDTTKGKAKGKLTQATANGVSRALEYNGLNGRLSKLTRTVDGLSFVQGLGYNSYGLLTGRTYPNHATPSVGGPGQVVAYDLYRQVPNSTNFNTVSLATMGYDPTSWALSTTAYQGAVSGANAWFTYGVDQTRLATMTLGTTWTDPSSGAAWQKVWSYGYDSRSNLLTDGEDIYEYDLLNRLTDAAVRNPFGTVNAGIHQAFSFDAFGNRISLKSEDITWTGAKAYTVSSVSSIFANYTFSSTNAALASFNRLPTTTSAGAATGATYDALGNLTRIYKKIADTTQSVTLAYDALGRVKTMADAKLGTTETYLHDDEGLRIKVLDSKTNTIKYNIYNEARQLIAQYEKVGTGALTWKRDIVYVGTKELAEVDATGTEITFVDHLGSPRFAWRGGTTPVIKQKFLPFGEQLTDPTTAKSFAKGFTNHEQTDPSGLIYMQARYYAPWYGRFLSPDPARDQHFEDTQTWNIYSYCTNNPIMSTDPTGMIDLKAFAVGVGRGIVGSPKAIWNGLTSTANAVAHPTSAAGKAFWSDHGKTLAATALLGPAGPGMLHNTQVASATKDALAKGDSQGAGKVVGTELGTQAITAAVGLGVSKGLSALSGGAPGPVIATEASVAKALEGSPMQTMQPSVSLPMVQEYVGMLESGQKAPAIKVDGNIIVDGNHRYVAGRLVGQEPAQVPGTAAASQAAKAKPVQELKVDPTDWRKK